MSFDFSTDGIRLVRYDGDDFIEENLLLEPAGGLDITQTSGTATYEISATTLSGNLQTDIDSNATDISTLSGYVGNTFVELAGDTMTGPLVLSGDPTISGHAANKFYVDQQISTAAVGVKDDNVLAVAAANYLDFGHALTVTSGGSEADIAVTESELTTVVFLTGNQTISGVKTFANDVVMEADLTVNGTTTTLNTETLLVEDNIVTLNSTVTGTPLIDSGLEVERGTEDNAVLLWDESEDYFAVGSAGVSGALERLLTSVDLTSIDADFATLSGLIDTNATDISTNASDITTLSGLIDTNATDISTNSSDITTLSGLIDTNATDISTNASDIATLSGYVDNTFVELGGDTMTGFLTLSADPTASGHAANKFYVDQQVASVSITVEEDNGVTATVSGVQTLNFGSGLDITDDGGNQVTIVVDETELNVVDLTSNQSISGTKTFLEPIVVVSGAEPASSSISGSEGEIRWSDDYVFICVSTNNWKRSALAAF